VGWVRRRVGSTMVSSSVGRVSYPLFGALRGACGSMAKNERSMITGKKAKAKRLLRGVRPIQDVAQTYIPAPVVGMVRYEAAVRSI
jgi:hypothetical protein